MWGVGLNPIGALLLAAIQHENQTALSGVTFQDYAAHHFERERTLLSGTVHY